MDNVMIKNAQGEQLSINVIRYFRLNGVEYLVFSLNEVDEGGYVKLYISKVNGDFANTITDDVEWNLIKDTVKTIIKSNKESLPLSITDLDIRKLSNVQVIDQKVFKLSETFLQLLGANKKIENYMETTQNSGVSSTPIQENIPVVEAINFEPVQNQPVMNPISVDNLTQMNPTETTAPTTQVVVSEPSVEPIQPTAIKSIEQPATNDFANTINVDIPNLANTTIELENSSLNNGGSDFGNTADYGLDYKILYENELNKNKLLTEENEKYKSMINNLKSIINEQETF